VLHEFEEEEDEEREKGGYGGEDKEAVNRLATLERHEEEEEEEDGAHELLWCQFLLKVTREAGTQDIINKRGEEHLVADDEEGDENHCPGPRYSLKIRY
jgi:hypothetical protein